jgi:AhpD family alkylhydroperoxidase
MPRIQISDHAPEGYRKVSTLDAYVESVVEPVLLNLVKLRASQINGCTYCVDLHSVDLAALVGERKVYSVTTWRESEWFDARERAALDLTESITRIDHGVSDEVWDGASAVFDEKELADLVLAIGTINIWNRIAIPTRMLPPALSAHAASSH